MSEPKKKRVPLGSGQFYLKEYDGNGIPDAAALVAMCTPENHLGYTKSGATITYSANVHKEQDDHGHLVRIVILDEEVKLRLGIFDWVPDTLTKLVATGRVVQQGKYSVLKIGGLNKDNGKVYVGVFKQIDPKEGDMYFAIVGTNTAGLSLAFARDNTTKLDPEFTAQPADDDGTLLVMFEDVPDAQSGEATAQTTSGNEPTQTS